LCEISPTANFRRLVGADKFVRLEPMMGVDFQIKPARELEEPRSALALALGACAVSGWLVGVFCGYLFWH
jgi:hypothetical protein